MVCSHFLMTFDVSPIVLKNIDESLNRDPAVIRWVLMDWTGFILNKTHLNDADQKYRWTLLKKGAKL